MSVWICGRPACRRDFSTPVAAKAARCHRTSVCRLNDRDDPQNRRKPSIQLNKKPAVVARQTRLDLAHRRSVDRPKRPYRPAGSVPSWLSRPPNISNMARRAWTSPSSSNSQLAQPHRHVGGRLRLTILSSTCSPQRRRPSGEMGAARCLIFSLLKSQPQLPRPWLFRSSWRNSARFPPVRNAASIQAGSRYIREIPDPSRSFTHLDRRTIPGCSQQQGVIDHVRLQPPLCRIASSTRGRPTKLSTRFRNSPSAGFCRARRARHGRLPAAWDREFVERGVRGMRWIISLLSRPQSQAKGRTLFRQVNLDQPTMHHDALEFPDGDLALVAGAARGSARHCAAAAGARASVD